MRTKKWRSVPTLLIGVLLGVVMLTPVSAHHSPAHTKKMIKKETKARKDADAAISKTYYRQSAPVTVSDDFAFGEVACPPGTEATGGGVSSNDPSVVGISTPTDGTGAFVANLGAAGAGFTGWGAVVIDAFGFGSLSFRVYVICQDASAVDSNYAAGSTTYRQPMAGRWSIDSLEGLGG